MLQVSGCVFWSLFALRFIFNVLGHYILLYAFEAFLYIYPVASCLNFCSFCGFSTDYLYIFLRYLKACIMFYVCRVGQTQYVKMLLNYGADPCIVNEHKKDVAAILKQKKNFRAEDAVKKHLASQPPPVFQSEEVTGMC